MPTTIESLELEIKSSSQSAVSGLEALTSSLDKLKRATSGGVGLTAVAKQISAVNTAASGLNSNSINNLNGLSRAIQTLSNLGGVKISSSIGTQITRIGDAIKGLNGIDMGGFTSKISELAAALRPLSELPKQNISSTLTQLAKIPDIFKELNSVDMGAFATKIKEVTASLQPLANEMAKISAGFSTFPTRIQKLIQNNEKLTSSNGKLTTSYVNLAAKLSMAYIAVKRMASFIASAIYEINSYIENVNLFNASMGEYAKEAQEYAEMVGEVMGIDPGEWMRYQGIFMTLATGFGVASDKAYIMSKNLTQLGYDMSSFFNMSFEDSMQKLQSAIAGELEPVRRVGYDLSKAALEKIAIDPDNYADSIQNVANALSNEAMAQYAVSNGYKKSFNDMTQAEKSQLRYIALMKQVTVVQGDMARTLSAPANQLRILKAQVVQCARAFGSIFIPVLNAVLPYVIAVVKVLRLLMSIIASLFGFTMPDVDYSGISSGVGGIGDAANDAADGLDNAKESAKKLKNYMMGFDELNVIQPPDESDASGGLGDLGLGGGELDFDLPTYDFLDALQGKLDTITEELKQWLGLTDDIDTWAEFFDTRLGRILILVGEIGAGFLLWKLSTGLINGILSLKKSLEALNKFGLGKAYTIAAGVTLTVTGLVIEWTGIIDAIKRGLDGLNFAEIVGGEIATTLGGALIGQGLGSAILGGAIAGIIAGIPAFVLGIYDAVTNGLNWLNGLLIPFSSTLAAAGIGAIIGALGGPIGAGIGALIGLAVGLVTDGIILICQEWDKISEFFDELFNVTIPQKWDNFVAWLQNLPDTISKWFDNLWQPIRDYDWAGLGYDIGQWLGDAVKSAIEFVTVTIPEWLKGVGEAVGTFFDEKLPEIIDNILKWFDELPEKLYNAVKNGWQWFVDIGTAIIDGIKEGWDTIWNAITEFVDGFVQGFKDALGINSPSTVFAAIGVDIVLGLLQGLRDKWDDITTFIGEKLDALKTKFSETWDNIKSKASETWDNIKSDASEKWEGIKTNLSTTWDNVKTKASETFTSIKTKISEKWNETKTDTSTKWSEIKAKLSTKWSEIKTNASEKFGEVKTSISNKWDESKTDASNKWSDIKSNLSITWNNIKSDAVDTFTLLSSSLSQIWSGIQSMISGIIGGIISSVQSMMSAVSNAVAQAQSMLSGAVSAASDALDTVKDTVKNIGSTVKNAITNVTKKSTSKTKSGLGGMTLRASGGFPDVGEVFIAREAGAEMVGSIGRRTAVANNDQIVAGIANGVAEANNEQNALLREQNRLLRALLEKDTDIDIDGKRVTEAVEKHQRERGRVILGGAY